MNTQRQHQIADQGRQERVDAGLAQPSQNDVRYLRGAEDYRYHRRFTDDFYRAGDEAYDRRPRGAIYLSDLDLAYSRRPGGAFTFADLQAAYNEHTRRGYYPDDLNGAYIRRHRRH